MKRFAQKPDGSNGGQLDRTRLPCDRNGHEGVSTDGERAAGTFATRKPLDSVASTNGSDTFSLKRTVFRLVRPRKHHSGNGQHEASRPAAGGARPAISGLSDALPEVPVDFEALGIPRWKRVLDLSCIALALPLWLPLMLLVMVLIRITSPGPVFYRQERIGYQRRRFMLSKFRTMRVNAETRTHEEYVAHLMLDERPMTKLDETGDDRLIPGGHFLRASGLDELPQIFNVLRGEMSLVGPRPCLPNEFECYDPSQQGRVGALPGLTGYWQVNGKNNTTFKEMIAMDLFYVHNTSIWLDLTIMLKTVPVLAGELSNSVKRRAAKARQAVRARASR